MASDGRLLHDRPLMRLNTDYRTKRAGDVGMIRPHVLELPPGTFHGWMRQAGRLGDQHKGRRVTNDRTVAEGLLAFAATEAWEPAVGRPPRGVRRIFTSASSTGNSVRVRSEPW